MNRAYTIGGIARTPSQSEAVRHDSYGEPYPDPADLLVRLVTERSTHAPTPLSDREIGRLLRLRSTDDALRLVRATVAAGRIAEQLDDTRTVRRLSIPFAPIVPETAPRVIVDEIRAALPPMPLEPACGTKIVAPVSAVVAAVTAIRTVDVPSLPPEPAPVPAPAPAPAPAADPVPEPTTTGVAPARSPATVRPPEQKAPPMSRSTKVVHLALAPEVHARFKALSDERKEPLAKLVTQAAILGLDADTVGGRDRDIATDVSATPPSAPVVPTAPIVIGDYGSIRVPLALFDAAGRAGISVPVFVEEVISYGMAPYIARETAKAKAR